MAPGADRRSEERASRLPDPASLLQGGDLQHRAAVARIVLRVLVLLVPLLALAYGLERLLPRFQALRGRATAVAGLKPGEPHGGIVEAAPEPAAAAPTPEAIARNQRSWEGSVTIAPREDRVDAATGERTGAFVGFGLQVDRPAGATVWVDGEEMGTAPLLSTVRCEPGAAVQVVVVRGPRRATTSTRCRRDTLVKLDLEFPAASPARKPGR